MRNFKVELDLKEIPLERILAATFSDDPVLWIPKYLVLNVYWEEELYTGTWCLVSDEYCYNLAYNLRRDWANIMLQMTQISMHYKGHKQVSGSFIIMNGWFCK